MLNVAKMAASFEDELAKIATKKTATIAGKGGSKALPLMAAGAVSWEALRRANQDRKLGRQIRKQQGNGMY